MNLLITICARGGSKGIPGKNIRKLNGKPLIAYSIEIAKKIALMHNGYVQLSTDSEEIVEVSKQFGVFSSYKRPEYLAGDRAGKAETIKHALDFAEIDTNRKYDFILDLDVTSPLRTMEDLTQAFQEFLKNKEALALFSVSPANRNPYFNMVELRPDGYAELSKSGNGFKSRQEAPLVYDMNASFYFYRRHFFEQGWSTALTDKSMIYLVPHLCFDLDHPHDFTIMEVLLRENLLGFSL